MHLATGYQLQRHNQVVVVVSPNSQQDGTQTRVGSVSTLQFAMFEFRCSLCVSINHEQPPKAIISARTALTGSGGRHGRREPRIKRPVDAIASCEFVLIRTLGEPGFGGRAPISASSPGLATQGQSGRPSGQFISTARQFRRHRLADRMTSR